MLLENRLTEMVHAVLDGHSKIKNILFLIRELEMGARTPDRSLLGSAVEELSLSKRSG